MPYTEHSPPPHPVSNRRANALAHHCSRQCQTKSLRRMSFGCPTGVLRVFFGCPSGAHGQPSQRLSPYRNQQRKTPYAPQISAKNRRQPQRHADAHERPLRASQSLSEYCLLTLSLYPNPIASVPSQCVALIDRLIRQTQNIFTQCRTLCHTHPSCPVPRALCDPVPHPSCLTPRASPLVPCVCLVPHPLVPDPLVPDPLPYVAPLPPAPKNRRHARVAYG